NLKCEVVERAVGVDLLARDGFAVHYDFHGNFSRRADPGPFQVPVRLVAERLVVERPSFLGVLGREHAARVHRGLDRAGAAEGLFAASFTDADVVDAEVDEVARAVGDVGSTRLDAFAELVEVELALGHSHIDAAEADALAVDAGEVRFAADLAA